MNKYLVTGGAGFIGSNIVKTLLEKGDTVRVIDNLSTGFIANLTDIDNQNFEFIHGDITDLEECKNAVEGIDYVLHQAALGSVPRSIEYPIGTNEANITGTLNLLMAAKNAKVKKFVYASSSSVYGDNPRTIKWEDMPINPISPYAVSKYAAERYTQLFHTLYGLPTICLRYFNVFGPNQNPDSEYAAVIPKFIKLALAGEDIIIYGNGEQSRDFTYVENVVQANILAAASGDEVNGEVFNIACNRETSLMEIVPIIADILGTAATVIHKPARQGDVLHSKAGITKARNLLGYDPKIKVREGLEKTIKWYTKNVGANIK